MITINERQLEITKCTITDPDIMQYFTEIDAGDDASTNQKREELLLQALRIGVIALRRTQTQVDTDAIRREFDDFKRRANDALEEFFKEDTGKLALGLRKYLGKGEVEDLFNPDLRNSAVGRIQTLLDGHFGGDGAKFTRLLDYTEPNSPPKKLQESLQKNFEKLQTQINEVSVKIATSKAREEERELSTQKGGDFLKTSSCPCWMKRVSRSTTW